jgi:hypothetical protein
MAVPGSECVNCGEPQGGGRPVVRGLCEVCYDQFRKAVKAGRLTWAALEAEGKALPLRATGTVTPAMRAFREREKVMRAARRAKG